VSCSGAQTKAAARHAGARARDKPVRAHALRCSAAAHRLAAVWQIGVCMQQCTAVSAHQSPGSGACAFHFPTPGRDA